MADRPGWDQKELTVGQLEARSGVATLRRVALIRVAQRVGIPLAEVRAALGELPDGRTPNREDWQHLSQRWQGELDERIHHLQQLRDEFSECIGCGCLSIDRCILANPYDELGRQGPGPRRLLSS